MHLAADFFYGCGLSFNVTNNPYFKAYIAGVSAAPPGHKPPSYYQLRVPLLARAKARLAPKLAAFLAAAKRTGYVICTDGWYDARNRSLYNFLVVTPSGAYFLMFVDTLGAEKSAAYIAEQLSLVRSSEDVSASSGSEGEMDGGGHRGANPCGGVILANTQVFKACIPPYRYSECVWRFE